MRLPTHLAAVAILAACHVADRPPDKRQKSVATSVASPFRVPSDSEIVDAEIIRSVRRGRAVLRNTRDSLPGHVGNQLACISCHAADGAQKNALPLVGVYARFPQYRARSGRVDLLEDRVNDCFERSMSGRAIDRGGPDMRDMIAYMAFLSRGVPAGAQVEGQGVPALEPLAGDTSRGAKLYAGNCAACHGTSGEGGVAAPPVWGPQSYNIGAGMARVRTAAAFIRVAMPQSRPGSLSAQQAFDLAVYINSRPRPDFTRKSSDWPRGDAPPDVAYPTIAGSRKPKAD